MSLNDKIGFLGSTRFGNFCSWYFKFSRILRSSALVECGLNTSNLGGFPKGNLTKESL